MKPFSYFLFFFIVLFGVHNILNAQAPCSDIPKNITTNPSNPFNEERPERTNTFFDWRKPSFLINSEYSNNANGTDEIASPFFDSNALSDMKAMSDNQDMSPEDGWELLDVQLGYKKEGDGTILNPVKDKENLYFILYNKYNGLMRIFAASTKKNKDYNGAKIRVSLEYLPSSIYNKTPPSTLDHAMGEFRALDAYQQKGAGPTVTSFSQYGTQDFKWFRADIITTYDPCVCKQLSQFHIEISLLEKSTINIEGSINQKVVTDVGDGKPTPENIGKRITTFAENVGKVVGAFTSTHESVNGFINEQKDKLAKIPALKFISELITKNKDLVAAVPVVGGIASAIDFIVGGGFKKKPTQTPPVVTTDYNANLSGSIDFVTHHQSSYLFNPGSYHHENPVINAFSQDAYYPLYNKKLGTFNLMMTPMIKVYDRTDVKYISNVRQLTFPYTVFDIPVDLSEKTHWSVVELADDIEYVVNPDAGFKLPPKYNAPEIYGSLIIETNEEYLKDYLPTDAELSIYNCTTTINTEEPWYPTYENPEKCRYIGQSIKGANIHPSMNNFVTIDEKMPFKFSTRPLPLSELKGKKIAFNTKTKNFKVYLKIIASLERKDADENIQPIQPTMPTTFMAKYPVKLQLAGAFSDTDLFYQKNTFQEFRISKSIEIKGNLTQPLISPTLPHFFGYRAWENITITNNALATNGVDFQKTIIGGNPNINHKVVAGNSIKIQQGGVVNLNNGFWGISYAPIEILPGTIIEISSPMSYPQNTLPPVSHEKVMWFCDRTYLNNRTPKSAPIEPESASEAPTTRLLTAYPNPTTDQVNISYTLAQTSDVEIYLSNMLGQRVATITVEKQVREGKQEVRFDTSTLPAGLYLYTLQTPTHKESKRLIIKK